MAFPKELQKIIYEYCENNLPEYNWYENKLLFIKDEKLRHRIINEFKSVRFFHKLYEGIQAKDENKAFEIRYQILGYASIYEAILHYVLYNYYNETYLFKDMTHYNKLMFIDIPKEKLEKLHKELNHNNKDIVTCYYDIKKRDESSIRFDAKCDTAKKLGILYEIKNGNSESIDIASDIIEIYNYRNGIHIAAEQRKNITYELELSKKAYRRIKPFIEQIEEKLKKDGKI